MRPLLHRMLAVVAVAGLGACGEGEAWMYDSAQLPLNVQAVSPKDAYRQTVHALVTQRGCGGCHKSGGLGSGAYADSNLETAFQTAVDMKLFDASQINQSKIIKKLTGNHNCGKPEACDDLIEKLTQAISDFSNLAPDNPFGSRGILSSTAKLPEGDQGTVSFELDTVREPNCIPTITLGWKKVSDTVVSLGVPKMKACSKNLLVQNMEVVSGSVANTFLGIDSRVVAGREESLVETQTAYASVTLKVDRTVFLRFKTLKKTE